MSFILRKLRWHGKLEAIFNYTRLTNCTCKFRRPPTLYWLLYFAWDKLVTNMIIRAAERFNLHCNNVARQVEEKCCPCYRTFTAIIDSLQLPPGFPDTITVYCRVAHFSTLGDRGVFSAVSAKRSISVRRAREKTSGTQARVQFFLYDETIFRDVT